MTSLLPFLKTGNRAMAVRAARAVAERKCGLHLLNLKRGLFMRTMAAWEEHVMSVPSMGDSITEGTVVEWLKEVGDFAQEDEVIAIVETDKVSVDIRAPVTGMVTKIMADIDAVVEVGNDLVSFDTSQVGSPAPAATVPETPAKAAAPVAAAEPAEEVGAAAASTGPPAESHVQRVPSIRFRHGDRSAIEAHLGLPAASKTVLLTEDDLYFRDHDFRVPHRPITSREQELINFGGEYDAEECF